MLKKKDIDSLVGRRLTEVNTGFCGIIASVYWNRHKMFIVCYRNSVAFQSFSEANIEELLEKSETVAGVRTYRIERKEE